MKAFFCCAFVALAAAQGAYVEQSGQYAAQSQYSQLYGGQTQESYEQLYGGAAQQPQPSRGSGSYGRPEPEEDDEEVSVGYGQAGVQPVAQPIATQRPVYRPQPTAQWATTSRATRRPGGYGQPQTTRTPSYARTTSRVQITHSVANAYPAQQAHPQQRATSRPSYTLRPAAQVFTTTRAPVVYQGAQVSRVQTSYVQPAQPAWQQPAQSSGGSGGYGNDLEDIETPGYGTGAAVQPSPGSVQVSSGGNAQVSSVGSGGYGNSDLEDLESGGYAGPAAQQAPQESHEQAATRRSSSGYVPAQELPNPHAAVGAQAQSYGSANPEYFSQTLSRSVLTAPAASHAYATVQQPVSYQPAQVDFVVVGGQPQW